MNTYMYVSQLCLAIGLIVTFGDARLIDIGMPHVRPDHDEHYLCKAFRLPADQDEYIVAFKPNATADKVHHILLYGCEAPGVLQRDSPHYVWECGEMTNDVDDYSDTQTVSYEKGPICAPGTRQSILFSWAMNAPAIDLPPGVGFRIGGSSGVRYIVMQVHYGHTHMFAEAPQMTDISGIALQTVPASDPTITREAGVLLLASAGRVKQGKSRHEITCKIRENKIIHPFRFRTHTHKLGQLVSGVKIGQDERQQVIGVGDPQKPQMFYPVVDNEMTLGAGDTITAFCDYENNLGHEVHIGPTGNDEMCNFYLMYWVEGPETLKMNFCQTLNADLLGF